MKIETKERIIKDTVYIAEDGKRFTTKSYCLQYEERLKERQTWEEEREKLNNLIMDFYDAPMTNVADCENSFTYFSIKDQKDLDLLKRVFFIDDDISMLENFPAVVICESYQDLEDIDTYDEMIENVSDTYWNTLDQIKKETIDYWKSLGYDITITKKDNQEEQQNGNFK